MSQSISQPTTPFADAEKTDIRRFCGYPAYGGTPSGFQSWRFFQVYGLMEFRMNNMSPSEIQVVRTYLATLYALESAIPAAGANLATDVAAVWTHNKNEVADRAVLFGQWSQRLCGFMGIPPGPYMMPGGGAGRTVHMVL